MGKEEFRNEKLYQTTMHLARKMLEEGIISDFRHIILGYIVDFRGVKSTEIQA